MANRKVEHKYDITIQDQTRNNKKVSNCIIQIKQIITDNRSTNQKSSKTNSMAGNVILLYSQEVIQKELISMDEHQKKKKKNIKQKTNHILNHTSAI